MTGQLEKISKSVCKITGTAQKKWPVQVDLVEIVMKALRQSGYDIVLKVPTSEMTPTELNDIMWSARWKQSTVARMAGCSRQNVNHWVKGRSPIPDNVACIMENANILMERLTSKL